MPAVVIGLSDRYQSCFWSVDVRGDMSRPIIDAADASGRTVGHGNPGFRFRGEIHDLARIEGAVEPIDNLAMIDEYWARSGSYERLSGGARLPLEEIGREIGDARE